MISRRLFIHAAIYFQSPGATKRQCSTAMYQVQALKKRPVWLGNERHWQLELHRNCDRSGFAAYFVGMLALVTLR